MAKAVKASAPAPPLVLDLYAPGMTPLLRAGLGGLAAALRALLLRSNPGSAWPAPIAIGAGSAHVEPQRVTIDFGGAPPIDTLGPLFTQAFLIQQGLIAPLGMHEPGQTPTAQILAALQSGIKRTFLQHGKLTKKDGDPQTLNFELDERQVRFKAQRYAGYVHQQAAESIAKALKSGTTELAGWAYPGAVQRHIAYAATRFNYTPAQALCTCFTLVGCLSYQANHNSGALIIPEPADLRRFAVLRPRLTPKELSRAYMVGAGDALLSLQLALRAEEAQQLGGVAAVHAMALRATPWAKQQKSRVKTLSANAIADMDKALSLYEAISDSLKTKLRVAAGEDEEGEDLYPAFSELRGFVTENLASGCPFYEGFATAVTADKAPRRLHQLRTKDNLGALRFEEREGLRAMIKHLDDPAEEIVVRSVHTALRQRFGQIWDDAEGQALATKKNRIAGESERWRLAFAGAKTADQIRGALADLWSRAGANKELREGWTQVLPLLRGRWQVVRDLALIALASYQGKGADIEEANESKPR